VILNGTVINDANVVATANIVDDAVTTVKILDANVTIAKLSATGTASSSTYLRGDNAWSAVSSAVASGAIYENTDTISADYTFTTGSNGHSVGPITIASGVTVTVPSGQRWVVA